MPIIPTQNNTNKTSSRASTKLKPSGLPSADFESLGLTQRPEFIAADIHNVANENRTFLEAATDTVSDIPNFLQASVLSAATQLYNIAPSLGNAFGGDFEVQEVGEVIEGIDSDLGKYYEDHEGSVDTLGFILSSIVPGLAGIKVLNAGQKVLRTAASEGKLGATMAEAYKLKLPIRDKYLAKAKQAVANNNNIYSITERNLIKAVGAGAGQAVLESAAFEIAVAATMYDAPLLKDQDIGDLAYNIAFGSLVGGAVGGVIDGARALSSVKAFVKTSDPEAAPWTRYTDAPEGASASDSLIHYHQQIKDMPGIPSKFTGDRLKFLQSAAVKTKEELNQKVRLSLNKLTGDQELTETLVKQIRVSDPKSVLGDFLGTVAISRVADSSKKSNKENIIKKALASTDPKLIAKGKLIDLKKYANTQFVTTKQWGEEAGKWMEGNSPELTQLSDLLKKKEVIKVTSTKVTAGKGNSWDFSKPHKEVLDRFDVSNSDFMTTKARQIWADKLPPFAEGQAISLNDLPLVEKAFKEFDKVGDTLRFTDSDKNNFTFSSADELLRAIEIKKLQLSAKLDADSAKGVYLRDPKATIAELKRVTGINFLVDNSLPNTVNARFQAKAGITKIALNGKTLNNRDLGSLINSLKHEEGHSVFNVLLDVGGIPKSLRSSVNAEMEKVSRLQRPDSWKTADKTGNHNYLRFSNAKGKAAASHELAADTFAYFSKYPDRMRTLAPTFAATFGHLVRPLSKDTVDKYMSQASKLSLEERASALNVRVSYLEGTHSADKSRDLFAIQSYSEDYTNKLKKAGAIAPDEPTVPVWGTPQHTVAEVDITPVADLDGNILEGITVIKQRQREYQDNLDRTFVSLVGSKEAAKYADITEQELLAANRLGAERGFAKSASANYGTLASKVAQIGNVTAGLKTNYVKQTQEALEGSLAKLVDKPEAAIEFAQLQATLRAIPEKYTLNEAGDAMVLTEVKRYESMLANNIENLKKPTINTNDAPAIIPIKNAETRELAAIHIELNGKRRESQVQLRSAQGVEHHVDTDVFYPIPVDQKAYPFFATVQDSAITGSGHIKTIYANTQQQLDEMIKKIQGEPGVTVRTKGEAEAHFKSIGQFDFDKTLHDNRFDVMLKRKGVSSPYYVPTDPLKIAGDLLNWHKQRASSLAMDIVSTKYEHAFHSLKIMGEGFTNLATSKMGNSSLVKNAESSVENPYMDMVKTALDIKNTTDYPFWVSANRILDDKLSTMLASTTSALNKSKDPKELAKINATMKEYGYKGAAYDTSMELLSNHTAPSGVVTKFVQKANAILATVVLRLDTLNAVNNTVGANVLLGAEAKAVIRAIDRGDEAAVGALAGLAKVKVPGTNKSILSTKKLVANSIAKFGRDTEDMQWFKDNRFVTSISDQYKWTLDQLTVHGSESAVELESKISNTTKRLTSLADRGEVWTGNKLAEEFNRFVAADVMKQMTDIAVTNNLMDSKTALSYINTFVNRTQGNYLASQRPMLFQGPIGQAIGLFQTYQFNLMQQLLRHVGEGSKKDSMTLLGLQGTIYGMNGMPAFHAINTHLIGNASGNQDHKDAYDAVYGAAGKDAGDWIMYGAASNFLVHPDAKINLYVRGDINPRQLTVVPTDIASLPIYQAATKVFSNLFNTAEGIAKGGDVGQVLLQGLEHNGISRPLAGLAQSMQALSNPSLSTFSTTSKGNVIATNDLVSLSTLGRLVGGKPLDSAIAVDQAFRLKAYAAADQNRRNTLGQAVKSTMIAGGMPTQEEVDEFAYQYASGGGSQKEFNKWMINQYNLANTSQVNDLRSKVGSQYSQSMQLLMGGGDLGDFNDLNNRSQ